MIIKSRLSQDLYKLSMLQVFFFRFPHALAEYRFKCRTTGVNLLEFRKEIEEEIDHLCSLKYTIDELDYLYGLRWITGAFVDFLEDFTLKRRYVHVGEKNGELDIHIDGPLMGASPFEIFLLKIVQEVYQRNVHPQVIPILEQGRINLQAKVEAFNAFVKETGIKPVVIDFGGRRAFSTAWHELVVKNLAENEIIAGTSDVDLARRLRITPIGTFAHEFVQSFQGLDVCPVMESQAEAFQTWADIYRGDLGIALSDTLGDAKFLIDFDMYFAKLFDGVRHDSGCPFGWADMMINHYKVFNIDPMTKTLVFSDGLDFNRMFELVRSYHGQAKLAFGIGTWLTNDLGVPALQNVIKQISCNGNPTAKLSNDPGKTMCEDENHINYLRSRLAEL